MVVTSGEVVVLNCHYDFCTKGVIGGDESAAYDPVTKMVYHSGRCIDGIMLDGHDELVILSPDETREHVESGKISPECLTKKVA